MKEKIYILFQLFIAALLVYFIVIWVAILAPTPLKSYPLEPQIGTGATHWYSLHPTLHQALIEKGIIPNDNDPKFPYFLGFGNPSAKVKVIPVNIQGGDFKLQGN